MAVGFNKIKSQEGQTAGLGNHVSTQGNPFWNSGFLSHSHMAVVQKSRYLKWVALVDGPKPAVHILVV